MSKPNDEHKVLLRSHLREIRAEASARDPDASEKLAARFPMRLLDRFGPNVAVYKAIGEELDTLPLVERLRKAGAKILLPRVESDIEMTFRLHQKDDILVRGPFGLEQPASNAEEVRPGLVLAPLLGFDGRGARLGYGKGFYDRKLTELRASGPCFYVGLCFSAQQVDAIPTSRHDVPLDWVETPDASVPLFLARASRNEQT